MPNEPSLSEAGAVLGRVLADWARIRYAKKDAGGRLHAEKTGESGAKHGGQFVAKSQGSFGIARHTGKVTEAARKAFETSRRCGRKEISHANDVADWVAEQLSAAGFRSAPAAYGNNEAGDFLGTHRATGVRVHLVETKTLQENHEDKIKVDSYALLRKVVHALGGRVVANTKRKGADPSSVSARPFRLVPANVSPNHPVVPRGKLNPVHTVAVDAQDEFQGRKGDRQVYYRRGAGSFRRRNMLRVGPGSDIKTWRKLADLMVADNANLPELAQEPTVGRYAKAITTEEGFRDVTHGAKEHRKRSVAREWARNQTAPRTAAGIAARKAAAMSAAATAASEVAAKKAGRQAAKKVAKG